MSTAAWKGLERRVCRALGGQRSGPLGQAHSDCTGDVPFAVEVKRSNRIGPPVLASWISQARKHSRKEGRPWIVVVAGHYDPAPVVCLDFTTFVEIAREAGRLGPIPAEPEEAKP